MSFKNLSNISKTQRKHFLNLLKKNLDFQIQVDVPKVSEIVREKTSVRKIALKFMYTGWDYQSYALTGKKEYNSLVLVY